jgi:predicted  nucleic acid-binding Zn-ribbon protein
VDASKKNDEIYSIALYDPQINRTSILDLNNIKNINEAELRAIFYAVYYVIKNDFKNIHILSDNQNAAKNNIIIDICKKYKIGVSWIPREINKVADKICKLDSTVKDVEHNIFNFFINVIFENTIINSDNDKDRQLNDENQKLNKKIDNLNKKIDTLNKELDAKRSKITNQANELQKYKSHNNCSK